MSNEACREDFEVMKAAWLEFVHNEKEKEGTGTYLPNVKRCYCDKSRTSYPHWPPTTLKEAVAQLKCLIGEFQPHRMYLAHCWMISLRIKLAAAEPRSKATIKQLISLVQEHCRITDRNELETGHMRRGKRICGEVCNPVLLEGRCYCLCSCGWHREECPVHRIA